MINEDALRDTLVAFTNVAKAQIELVVSAMAEITAVRESIRGLDPTFDETFAQKRQQALERVLPSAKSLIAALEAISQKLVSGEVC